MKIPGSNPMQINHGGVGERGVGGHCANLAFGYCSALINLSAAPQAKRNTAGEQWAFFLLHLTGITVQRSGERTTAQGEKKV